MNEVWEWLVALVTPLLTDVSLMVKGAIPALVVGWLLWTVVFGDDKDDRDGKKPKKKGDRE